MPTNQPQPEGKPILVLVKTKKTLPLEKFADFQAESFKSFTKEAEQKLRKSILRYGFFAPIFIWEEKQKILDGHHRIKVLRELEARGYEIPEVPIVEISAESESDAAEKVLLINSRFASIKKDGLEEFLAAFNVDEAVLELIDIPEIKLRELGEEETIHRPLAEDFIVPPLSVLDARLKNWINRKKLWQKLGIVSEAGRDKFLTFAYSAQGTEVYDLRNKMRQKNGGVDPSWDEILAEAAEREIKINEGTSIFDPVLCEVAYKWFCPKGGQILDPFAGGSVRGVVAGKLGFDYLGVDLRKEQIESNEKQADEIFKDVKREEKRPAWVVGNSLNIDKIVPKDLAADFIFSCPPYFDLEQYSDNEEDLSNLEYEEFKTQYREIIKKSVAKLKPNRFACFVVGDVRRKEKGKFCEYRNFVSETISAFIDAGAHLYNEIILLNQISGAIIRCRKQFENSRKVGKVHQNVLVFYKGDPENTASEFEKYRFNDAKFREIVKNEVAKEQEMV